MRFHGSVRFRDKLSLTRALSTFGHEAGEISTAVFPEDLLVSGTLVSLDVECRAPHSLWDSTCRLLTQLAGFAVEGSIRAEYRYQDSRKDLGYRSIVPSDEGDTQAMSPGARLEVAGRAGEVDLVRRLVVSGSDPTKALKWGIEHSEIVEFALDQGANIHGEPDGSGWVPLGLAAGLGAEESVRVLLKKGAEINEPGDSLRWTPLMSAAYNGHAGTVRILIEGGAEIEARDRSGKTALMWAASHRSQRRIPIIKALVQSGADRKAKDDLGRTAYWYAAEQSGTSLGRKQAMELLKTM